LEWQLWRRYSSSSETRRSACVALRKASVEIERRSDVIVLEGVGVGVVHVRGRVII
jgi:hypothetical protein